MSVSEKSPSDREADESSRRLFWPVFVLLLVFHCGTAAVYLDLDQWPLGIRATRHFASSVAYLRGVTGPFDIHGIGIGEAHAPLLFVASLPFYRILGVSADVACLSTIPFFALLLWSIYGIGRALGGVRAGLLGMVAVSFFPWVFGLLRSYLPELAAASLVAWHIREMLCSDGLRSPGARFRAALALGLSAWARLDAPLYALGADLWLLRGLAGKWKFLGKMLVCFAVVASPWYLAQASRLWLVRGEAAEVSATSLGLVLSFSVGNLGKVTAALVDRQLGMLPCVIVLGCSLGLLAARDRRALLPAAWFGWAFLVAFVLPACSPWALLLAVGACAIALGLAIEAIGKAWLRAVALTIVFCVLALEYVRLHTADLTSARVDHAMDEEAAPGTLQGCLTRVDSWHGSDMIERIADEELERHKKFPSIGPEREVLRVSWITADVCPLWNDLVSASAQRGIDLHQVYPWDLPWDDGTLDRCDSYDLERFLGESDYAVELDCCRRWVFPGPVSLLAEQRISETWSRLKSRFQPIAEYGLPVGCRAILYRKLPEE